MLGLYRGYVGTVEKKNYYSSGFSVGLEQSQTQEK